MDKYVVVPHLVRLQSNVKRIVYYSIGYSFHKYFNTEAMLELTFKVVDNNEFKRPVELKQRFDYFFGRHNTQKIYYQHPLFYKLEPLKMIFDYSGKVPTLKVNHSYFKLAKYKFENVVPPGVHLMNLTLVELLKRGYLTLHCASFAHQKTNKVYLIFGASNTGKSYTTFSAVQDGCSFLSEDITVVGKKNAYSAPYVSVKSKLLPNQDFILRLNRFVQRILFLGLLMSDFSSAKSFFKFIKGDNYATKGKIDKVFILERGKREISKLDKETSFQKLLTLNRMEFSYYKDHLLLAYSYFNQDFQIGNLMKQEEKLIKKLVKNNECYLISNPDPDKYYPSILDLISDK
jgi:hypothetical protein